ncbi:uncharacterized protein LOC105278930 [Ooceraea biroi]|uniref:uncharacterized protein LOC105278930 n=1 Tax=Ooceraea biroi TaxID=2015173 RepID=UPI000F0875F1|nr:uncharacterized protein LOC105278930 [Ooceraea biroi]
MFREAVCLCPSVSQPSSHLPLAEDVCPKYYQEIGAEMISNQLIIRLEKDRNRKRKKKLEEWDPPCDCVEIQRPTSKTGPKIINADYDDRIVFRVHWASRFPKEDPAYRSQTIAYKIDSCREKEGSHQCKTITVYPQFISGSQEVYSDHITEGNQDIFLLRIKKKAEYSEQSNRNVELEVRTPKPPTPTSSPAIAPPQPVRDLVVEHVVENEEPSENTDDKLDEKPVKKSKTQPKRKKKKKQLPI